jgi:hypothetical protein
LRRGRPRQSLARPLLDISRSDRKSAGNDDRSGLAMSSVGIDNLSAGKFKPLAALIANVAIIT